MPYCQSCGTYGETAFCTKCGNPLTAPQRPTEPTPAVAPATVPAEIPAPAAEPAAVPQGPAPAEPATPQPAIVQEAPQAQPAVVEPVAEPAPDAPQQQPAYGQPPDQVGAQAAYAQQPAYQAQPPSNGLTVDPYMAPHGQPGTQKVASAYYLAIVALIFAFLGGLLGMILALVAGWLAKKQAAQGLAKTQQAIQISNLAFIIALVVFIIVINL